MKKGTTSIQNIETETVEKFRQFKREYEVDAGREATNDEVLRELLK